METENTQRKSSMTMGFWIFIFLDNSVTMQLLYIFMSNAVDTFN